MRKLMFALTAMGALMLAGLLTWSAEATTLAGTVGQPPATNYSPVEKVGCGGAGRCPYGLHWACGPYGRCACIACGGPYVAHPYVAHPYVYVRPRWRY
jgi:hypothetical protein